MNKQILYLLLLLPVLAQGLTTSQLFGFRSANDTTYGATCGGSNDDGTGINSAISAANTVGGGTVYLAQCATQYDVTTFINLKSNVTLDCQGSTIKAAAAATSEANLYAIISSKGTTNAGVQNCVVDVSNNTFDGNGIAFGPTTPNSAVTHPMVGNTITGTGIPASTVIGSANRNSPFTLTLHNSAGVLVNATASGTVTLTINGLAYTGTTTNASPWVSAVTPTTPNYMGSGNFIKHVKLIGNSTPSSQYIIWLRQVQDVTLDDIEIDGGVVPTAANTADGGYFSSLDSDVDIDQDGIECYSCRNVSISNLKIRGITNGALAILNASDAASFSNSDVTVNNVNVEGSTHCLWLQSDYSTTYGLRQLRNIAINNYNCKNPLKKGLYLQANSTSTNPAGAVVYDNVVINNANVDNSGSPLGTNKGTYALHVRFPYSATGTLVTTKGFSIQNSNFKGGGWGTGSTGSRYGAFGGSWIEGAGNLSIANTTFNDVVSTMVTGGQPAMLVQYSNDLSLTNVTFRNNIRRAAHFFGSRRLKLVGTKVLDFDTSAAGNAGVAFEQSNPGGGNIANTDAQVLGTACYQTVGSGYCFSGDGSSTGFDIAGTTCKVGSGSNLCDYGQSGTYATETGTTQTHGFGCYSPADAGANPFTITNSKVYAGSRIAIRQTAGTVNAVKVSAANGSFAVTGAAAWAGTSTFCYTIIN